MYALGWRQTGKEVHLLVSRMVAMRSRFMSFKGNWSISANMKAIFVLATSFANICHAARLILSFSPKIIAQILLFCSINTRWRRFSLVSPCKQAFLMYFGLVRLTQARLGIDFGRVGIRLAFVLSLEISLLIRRRRQGVDLMVYM